jgi:hypothetical protein
MSLSTIKKYSNPTRVLTLSKKYYKQHSNTTTTTTPLTCSTKRAPSGTLIGKIGSNAGLYVSTRKNKKYMLFNGCKTVHFGQLPYEDYTKHKNKTRRQNYLRRATNIKGDWKKDPYSPNNLAIHLLW